jgi:DNA-binding NarL/FixJ family response regulator
MVMPKQGGKEAYYKIKELSSDIKVLFLSGYTADRLERDRLFADPNINFMTKPASPGDLLRRVREMLDK